MANYSYDEPCDILTGKNHSATPYHKLNDFWDLYNGVPFNLTVNVCGFLVRMKWKQTSLQKEIDVGLFSQINANISFWKYIVIIYIRNQNKKTWGNKATYMYIWYKSYLDFWIKKKKMNRNQYTGTRKTLFILLSNPFVMYVIVTMK
jgi:hypothetical protein